MIVSDGRQAYTWREAWAGTPDAPASRANGRIHGLTLVEENDAEYLWLTDVGTPVQ